MTSNLLPISVSPSQNSLAAGAGQFKKQNYVDWSKAPDV
jgi:hypothetical protein